MPEPEQSLLLLYLVPVVLLGLRFDVMDCLHVGLLLDVVQLILLSRTESRVGGHWIILTLAVSVSLVVAIVVNPVVKSADFGTLLSLDHFH